MTDRESIKVQLMNKRERSIARAEELTVLCEKYAGIMQRLHSRTSTFTPDQLFEHTTSLLVKFLEEAEYLPEIAPPLTLDDVTATTNQPE